jgi:hypothetical protein
MNSAQRVVPYQACRAVHVGQSRAAVIAALGSAPAMEVLLHDGEAGIASARWPAVEASGAPGWLYVSFDREDRVLGHALIPRPV